MEEELSLISVFEVYNMTDDYDDFIENILIVYKVIFFRIDEQ